MHQFRWLSERGGNFLSLLKKKGGTQKVEGSLKRGSKPGRNYEFVMTLSVLTRQSAVLKYVNSVSIYF